MSTYEISQSSLLSLKAEILRKHEELSKQKTENDLKIKVIKKNTPLEIKNKGIEARIQSDFDQEVDKDLLKQSRESLEIKAALYDKLSQGKLSEEERILNRRFLVRFDKKNKSRNNDVLSDYSDEEPDKYPESEEEVYKSDEDSSKNPAEEWVDYVDCLGRTRKCLRKDLEYFKSKDQDLKEVVESRKRESESSSKEVRKSPTVSVDVDEDEDKREFNENSEMLSNDMRRELLRQQWEKEEEELQDKTNIHYQDILYGEARSHGVGYYGFSKNEEERLKQQEALNQLRKETEEKQKKAQELKALREKQLAARIKAAKDRKRARLGLPPEEEEPEPAPVVPNVEDEKKKEEEQKKQAVEKLLEEARKRHIRPWDVGKDGVKAPKEHYEMTQEEWVDKKRSERPKEFAPPTNVYDDSGVSKSLRFTSRKTNNEPNLKRKWQYEMENSSETSKSSDTRATSFEPTPIVDESGFEDSLLADYNATVQEGHDNRGRGVEIAPPSTFEYYGPSGNKTSKPPKSENNIEDSIEAGLKFLKKQVEKKQKTRRRSEDIF